jgi:protein-S-isoprenylcysteine O-methyltransferase Ste14
MQGMRLYVLTAVQVVAASALLWWQFTAPGVWDFQRVAAVCLTLIGIGGIATARYQLGKSFAVKAEARQLITHGIYSKIRNPIYVFGIPLIAGFVLMVHRPTYWLIVPVIAIMQTVRARRESRVLEAAFGDAYREYRRTTWF